MRERKAPRVKQPPAEKRLSPAERRAVVDKAKAMLALGRPRPVVINQLVHDANHSVDEKIAERACVEAMSEMRALWKVPLEDHRAMKLERLMSLRIKAEAKGTTAGLNAAIAAEREIGALKGTNAPARVHVEVPKDARDRVANVLMLLPQEALAGILAGERPPIGYARGMALPEGQTDEEA